jgi:hypothetical protein
VKILKKLEKKDEKDEKDEKAEPFIKIDYDEYILKQIGKPIIADLMRLNIPVECLNYILYKIFVRRNGQCGKVAIVVKNKEKILPNGEKDLIAEVKIGITKKGGKYFIKKENYYYVDFLKSSKTDIKNGILELY